MWCGTCQSDVVTEVASDHRRVSCSICGATLGETAASQQPAGERDSPRSERTSQARDLLDRWAKSPLFDPYGPAKSGASTEPVPDKSQQPAADSPPPPASSPSQESGKTSSATPESAKSEDLDRLTEEILSRVARITESIREPGPKALRQSSEAAPPPAPESPGQADSASTGSDRADPAQADSTALNTTSNSSSVEHVQDTPSQESVSEGSVSASDTKWRLDAGASPDVPQPAVQSARSFDAAGNPVPPISIDSDRNEHSETARDDSFVSATEFPNPVPPANLKPPQASGFVGGIGQVLAYLGILGLTAGTTLVIVGYFGGPAHYAPTGWLVTTIGQMMLFLGVVTLVSTGMEQTQAEVRESLDETLRQVSARIDVLSQQLTRIDSTAHQTPPAPHLPARIPVEKEAESAPQ